MLVLMMKRERREPTITVVLILRGAGRRARDCEEQAARPTTEG
jgi:hypothetical protein